MTTYPRAEAILDNLYPVLAVCNVTRELYGYAKPVVDVAATLDRFRVSYEAKWGKSPRPAERAVAEDHINQLDANWPEGSLV